MKKGTDRRTIAPAPTGGPATEPVLGRQDVDVAEIHVPHPKIRAEDWRAPLVCRLADSSDFSDGDCEVSDSYRPPGRDASDSSIQFHWKGMTPECRRYANTYQEHVVTEHATLGLACALVHSRAQQEITEVTLRGDKADYWLGDRELLLEVSGKQNGDLAQLCDEKAKQLLSNPFGKGGYVCVAVYADRDARLWFFPGSEDGT